MIANMLKLRRHSEVFPTAHRKGVSWNETLIIQVKNCTAKFLGKRTRVWRKKYSAKNKVVFFFYRHYGLPEYLCPLVSDKRGHMRSYYGLPCIKRENWLIKGRGRKTEREDRGERNECSHLAFKLCSADESALDDKVE